MNFGYKDTLAHIVELQFSCWWWGVNRRYLAFSFLMKPAKGRSSTEFICHRKVKIISFPRLQNCLYKTIPFNETESSISLFPGPFQLLFPVVPTVSIRCWYCLISDNHILKSKVITLTWNPETCFWILKPGPEVTHLEAGDFSLGPLLLFGEENTSNGEIGVRNLQDISPEDKGVKV